MPSGRKVIRIGKRLYYSCDEGCQAGGGAVRTGTGLCYSYGNTVDKQNFASSSTKCAYLM